MTSPHVGQNNGKGNFNKCNRRKISTASNVSTRLVRVFREIHSGTEQAAQQNSQEDSVLALYRNQHLLVSALNVLAQVPLVHFSSL